MQSSPTAITRAEAATVRVELEPVGRRVSVPAGTTILDAARAAGVALVSSCGGLGICGDCRVRLVRGAASPPSPEEAAELTRSELAVGFRLACRAVVGRVACIDACLDEGAEREEDVCVDIPPASLATPHRLQLEGRAAAVACDPAVAAVDVRLAPPSVDDLRADDERLADALRAGGLTVPAMAPRVLAGAAGRLREQGWTARLVLRRADPGEDVARGATPALVAVLPPASRLFGLAVDVGTTKLAAYLADLETGETVARAGAVNPQVAFGEDVVSRIAYADRSAAHGSDLQARLVEALSWLVDALCRQAGTLRAQIVDAVVVGNTAMHHLFAGLPVCSLGAAPYVPVVRGALSVPAHDVGLALAAGAHVYLPPNVAGYVGADHVAMLLAAGVDAAAGDEVVLALDIGTNTEVTLAAGGRLLSCACASGPAFEGAHVRDGMRAVPGAVERVRYAGGTLHCHTIGDRPPVGLCGSGLLDAVAALHAAGAVDRRGAFVEGHPAVRRADGRLECVLVPASRTGHGRDLVLTRGDIHQVQLAKGAIRAGIEILLREAGVAAGAVERVVVAGAFGTYLDVDSALRLGMFPSLPRDRFEQVGNAAGVGALRLLTARAERRRAAAVARRLTYVELTTHPAFADTFTDALFLGY